MTSRNVTLEHYKLAFCISYYRQIVHKNAETYIRSHELFTGAVFNVVDYIQRCAYSP